MVSVIQKPAVCADCGNPAANLYCHIDSKVLCSPCRDKHHHDHAKQAKWERTVDW